MNRIISIALIIAFALSAVPCGFAVFAAEEQQAAVYETFNDYPTNNVPESITLSGGKGKVAEVSPKDKAFLIDVSSAPITCYRQAIRKFG